VSVDEGNGNGALPDARSRTAAERRTGFDMRIDFISAALLRRLVTTLPMTFGPESQQA